MTSCLPISGEFASAVRDGPPYQRMVRLGGSGGTALPTNGTTGGSGGPLYQ
jgi:hypothetical protein